MAVKHVVFAFLVLFTGAALSSCSGGENSALSGQQKAGEASAKGANPLSKTHQIKRITDEVKTANGLKLFRENCATCHGENGEGGPNWKQPDKNGAYPPPPLNGDGHAWHHPMSVLKKYIKDGSKNRGGNMDAFKDKLNDSQIDEIISWFQSQWSEDKYSAWSRNNASAGNKNR